MYLNTSIVYRVCVYGFHIFHGSIVNANILFVSTMASHGAEETERLKTNVQEQLNRKQNHKVHVLILHARSP